MTIRETLDDDDDDDDERRYDFNLLPRTRPGILVYNTPFLGTNTPCTIHLIVFYLFACRLVPVISI